MFGTFRKQFIVLLMLVLGGGLAMSGFVTPSLSNRASAEPVIQPWPAMDLVYEIEGKFQGLDAPTGTKVWKLSYEDSHHWRKELIANSLDPKEVGAVATFQDTTYTVYSAALGQVIHRGQYTDAPMAPEQWFFSGRDQVLESRGYTNTLNVEGQRVSYTKTETIPCEEHSLGQPEGFGKTQPTICKTSPTYLATETIVYRMDPVVPVEVITQIAGEIVQHITVTELTIQKR